MDLLNDSERDHTISDTTNYTAAARIHDLVSDLPRDCSEAVDSALRTTGELTIYSNENCHGATIGQASELETAYEQWQDSLVAGEIGADTVPGLQEAGLGMAVGAGAVASWTLWRRPR